MLWGLAGWANRHFIGKLALDPAEDPAAKAGPCGAAREAARARSGSLARNDHCGPQVALFSSPRKVRTQALAMTNSVSNRESQLRDWLALAPQVPPLATGQQWHVFLSYRSVNRTWVLHLYDALRTAGFAVFVDQLEIAAGDSLARRLNGALSSSQSGVIVGRRTMVTPNGAKPNTTAWRRCARPASSGSSWSS
jgi:TIR domain